MNFAEHTHFKKPFIIAEISCNHEGDFDSALCHIKEAKYAGADAAKIQVYEAEDMTLDYYSEKSSISPFICQNGPWKGEHLFDLYKKTGTPLSWVPGLFNYAKEVGIPLFASVFSARGLDALELAGCPAYKIASFEANHTELLKDVATTKKPVLISTGCTSITDLDRALEIIPKAVFMHCVSKYPTEFRLAELARIKDLIRYNSFPVGYSDHTRTVNSAQMALAMGASIFEKHLSLSPTSADASFSLNKFEFINYVTDLGAAHEAIATKAGKTENQYKRSIFIIKDVKAGERLTEDNLGIIRPSNGLAPYLYPMVLNSKAKNNLRAGTPLEQGMYEYGPATK